MAIVDVSLRPVEPADLPVVYENQRDAEACRMVAYVSREYDAFMEHWKNVLSNPEVITRTIVYDGKVAGNISFFMRDGSRLIGYWLGKEFWGKGIATSALRQFLPIVPHRPLMAHVAKHNARSIRVLEKCGFVRISEGIATRNVPAGEVVEEFMYRLEK